MSEEKAINLELIQIIKEFVNDLSRTFPEKMNNDYYNDIDNNLQSIYNFCKEVYPKQFFDILYQNNSLFEEKIELLPNIDFN